MGSIEYFEPDLENAVLPAVVKHLQISSPYTLLPP